MKSSESYVGKNTLPNAATLTGEAERNSLGDGGEILWFSLKKGEELFRMGLSDILLCLKFAEEQGEVPELPPSWWVRLSALYPQIKEHFPDEYHGIL